MGGGHLRDLDQVLVLMNAGNAAVTMRMQMKRVGEDELFLDD